jgi:hypothetical protein
MYTLYGKNLDTIKKMVLLCESVCLIVNQKYQKKYDKLMEIVSQDYELAGFAKTKLERENALKNHLI